MDNILLKQNFNQNFSLSRLVFQRFFWTDSIMGQIFLLIEDVIIY